MFFFSTLAVVGLFVGTNAVEFLEILLSEMNLILPHILGLCAGKDLMYVNSSSTCSLD